MDAAPGVGLLHLVSIYAAKLHLFRKVDAVQRELHPRRLNYRIVAKGHCVLQLPLVQRDRDSDQSVGADDLGLVEGETLACHESGYEKADNRSQRTNSTPHDSVSCRVRRGSANTVRHGLLKAAGR